MNGDIFKLADRLAELRAMKKDTEDRLKEINAEIEKVDAELAERMLAEEVQNFSRNGQTFYLNTTVRASAKADRKQDLFQWFKEHGLGDMVTETVNANTLSAWVREQLEESDELPEGLEELVNVYEKTTVGIRKAR